ncbi:MAG TPA: phosphoglycerate dehydrogenase [Pseudomonadales bacterium]|nr:phosphoglycerate dehydrogenase [Pseudomonadales bacterium]
MFKIKTFNSISLLGLNEFGRDKYEVSSDSSAPDAILLRSHKLQADEISSGVRAIARAGAGTNNIPIETCSERGIVVFNTPGANANAVKELVLAGMLLGSRGIVTGMSYVNSQTALKDPEAMSKLMEAEKKRFKGNELKGKTLGVVGLGAIGSMVAKTALNLGMKVVGYDPALSVDAAWRLPSEVVKIENLSSLLAKSDFVTLHLPVLESTRHLINKDSIASFKRGGKLLNFAREEIVDTQAVVWALEKGIIGNYIADFPHPDLIGLDGVMLMPHIGASTDEAEDNCAVMAVEQLKNFLENGNIINSVNFPMTVLERSGDTRIAISNKNIPKMLGQILSELADQNINVVDMINKSRGELAYSLIDVEGAIGQDVVDHLMSIEGVIGVRVI